MKESKFTRVLFCKINCPFICFCKPSAAHHLYTQRPLKLKNRQRVPASGQLSREGGEVNEESVDERQEGETGGIRSCIRKTPSEENENKRVKWVDSIGQELAEVKEFESSETGETENEEENRNCLCIIF